MTMDSILAIVGAVGGATAVVEVVKFLLTRRQIKRRAESEADQATADAKGAAADAEHRWIEIYEKQIERMNTQIVFKDKRIEDLNAEIAEQEKQFREQTNRLRESQDREHASQLEINRLNGIVIEKVQIISQLELLLKDVKCHRLTCLDREPKNSHTKKAEAEVQSGAPTERLKQTTHRKKIKENGED